MVKAKIKNLIYILVCGLICLGLYNQYNATKLKNNQQREKARKLLITRILKENLNKIYDGDDSWPEIIQLEDETKVQINYTFDKKLTQYIGKLLKRYRPDYSAVIVLDNSTGEVISALGFEGKTKRFNMELPFSSSHPSASLFKIITSAELIQNSDIDNFTTFDYRGKGTTLYKYQLKDKKDRWTRTISFEKAFASSNNVVFGKAAIKKLTGFGLFEMAVELGFNKSLMKEISLQRSYFEMPKNQYNLAEFASGFNRTTTISPIHAAVLASIVANDGIMRYPHIVQGLFSLQNGKEVWKNEQSSKRVLNLGTTMRLQRMMELTVKKGTAKKYFGRMGGDLKRKLEIGGKTGRITGGEPFGTRDWFTVYAIPKNKNLGKGISISVMNVNIDKWRIKSTDLAKEIIGFYYKDVNPVFRKITKKISQKDKAVTDV